ncbi:MAG: hypothetical protein ABUS47_12065 [Steroidobacter sp.]
MTDKTEYLETLKKGYEASEYFYNRAKEAGSRASMDVHLMAMIAIDEEITYIDGGASFRDVPSFTEVTT